jgi:capsular polysaccharide export protein
VKRFLFLQGPISPFFTDLAAALRARGHATHRINLCLGDKLFWRGPEAVDFRGSLAQWPDFVSDFLDQHAITHLVLLGEQRVYHRIAIGAAHARSIPVAATDFGYIRPDRIILERDGHNAMSHFPRTPADILQLAEGAPPLERRDRFQDAFARQARWDIAFHLANLLPWPFRHFETHLLNAPIPNYIGTGVRLALRPLARRQGLKLLAGLPADAPLFVFAMQMEMDFSLRAYSPFPDLDTPMRETIASFAAHAPPEAHLVFKVHPLDPGLKWWSARVARMARRAGVAGRVHFVDGPPLRDMVARARGVITVNSTAAIEALEQGRPVLALGEAVYRVPGLTHESGRDSFWTASEPPEPALVEAFLRALGHHLHVIGGYYDPDALRLAVAGAAERLDAGEVGPPVLMSPVGPPAGPPVESGPPPPPPRCGETC